MAQQSTTLERSTAELSTEAATSPLEHIAARYRDIWLLLGRLAIGTIFVTSGFEKLTDLGKFAANLAGKSVPMSDLLAPLGGGVEFFGGVALVLGFRSRITALLMLVFVVVATAISHRYWEFDGAARVPQEINFYKNLCIFGGVLIFFATGAGRLSVDGLLARWRGRQR